MPNISGIKDRQIMPNRIFHPPLSSGQVEVEETFFLHYICIKIELAESNFGT